MVEPRASCAERTDSRAGWRAALFCAGVFLAATLPMILSGTKRGPGWGDQWSFHMVTIDRFIVQWPWVNIRDYESATTPFFHFVVGGFGHFFGDNLAFLQFVGSMLSLAMVMIVARWLGSRLGVLAGVLLTLPLIVDTHFYARAVHLNPDNTGWLFVAISLFIALRAKIDWTFYIATAVALTLVVASRQVHLWIAGVAWAAAWLGPVDAPLGPGLRGLLDGPGPRLRRTALAVLATLPALAVLGYFVYLWGSLVPPLMQTNLQHRTSAYALHRQPIFGGNTSIAALTLALVGVYGPLLIGYHWPTVLRLFAPESSGRGRLAVLVGAIIGLVVGVVPETSTNPEAMRFGDTWTVTGKFPVIAERSTVIVGASMVGGVVLAIFWLSLDRRTRWLFVATWLGFVASQMVSCNPWQRYIDPGILLLLATFTALAVSRGGVGAMSGVRPPRWAPHGPVLLAMFLAAITYLKYVSVPPPEKPDRQPLMMIPGGTTEPIRVK